LNRIVYFSIFLTVLSILELLRKYSRRKAIEKKELEESTSFIKKTEGKLLNYVEKGNEK
jgi:hypothetical protein